MREDSKVYSTGAASEDFSGAVVYARYNISEDMSKTELFNTSNVKALKVDGEVMEFEPEVETSGELTVLGENISFDMDNGIYTVPDEYLFDNANLNSLVVRPANGDISIYNAVCVSFSMGGMNYPMPLMFEEAEDAGIMVDYENNFVDLSPMLEMLSMYYPGNSSVCMLSVDESTETLVLGDTLVSFSRISGGMPTVFDFESAGEHEIEFLLKDGESLGLMFANNFVDDYGLVEVVIPDTVKYLDDDAFRNNNNLSKVTIPDSVESIGSECFRGCHDLISVNIPTGVTYIGESCFFDCNNINNIVLPDTLEVLNEGTFNQCKSLNNIVLPNSLTSIGGSCFRYCTFTEITLPEKITSIGDWAFECCEKLENIILPNSITTIGIGVFRLCSSLKNVTLPNSIDCIEDQLFSGCNSLTELVIPDSVKRINYYSIEGCRDLQKLVIGSGVEFIENQAIMTNFNLNEIHCYSTSAPVLENTYSLSNLKDNGLLFYPNGSDYSTWLSNLGVRWKGVACEIVDGKFVIPENLYKFKYFTINPLSDITIKFSKRGNGDNIRYQLNNSNSWLGLNNNEILSVGKGDKCMFKSTITPGTSDSNMGIGTFFIEGEFDVEGNIMSLLYGDEFDTNDTMKPYAFSHLFSDFGTSIPCNVKHAHNLCLPSTNMENSCYYCMFYYCNGLLTPPTLPAVQLADSCYGYMFGGCQNLEYAPVLAAECLKTSCYTGMFAACEKINEVVMLAIDFDGTMSDGETPLKSIVSSASPTGTLYKHPSLSVDTLNTYLYNFPEGWTVEDYQG